ncbi:lipid-binding protein [Bacteroidota bacterium]
MKNKVLFLLIIFSLAFLNACKKEAPEQEFSTAYPVSGDWLVIEDYGGGNTYGPYSLIISNTAANNESEILIDNIYDSGMKCKASRSGNSFSAVKSEDLSGNVATISIQNGTVFNNDSEISMVILLFNANGDTIDMYDCYGDRKTGFEDH